MACVTINFESEMFCFENKNEKLSNYKQLVISN